MLELVTQFVQTKNRTEMKRYLLLVVLTCLLGSNALAQKKSASNTSFTHEVYDFTQSTNHYGTTETARTICTGSWAFNGNWSGTKYDIASSNLNNISSLAVGQIIRVNYTPNNGGTSDGAIKKYGTYDNLPGLGNVAVYSNYYEAVITNSEAINEITANGLTLQAAYMTITSVQVISTNNDALTWNGYNLVAVSGTTFPKADRISVSSTSGWNIWSSDENQCSYFQRASDDVRYVYINNINVGDIVRIWCQGDCRILTDNTATHDTNDPLVWIFNDPDPNYSQKNNNGQYPDRNVNAREGVQLKETLYRTKENQDSPWNIIDQNPDGNELKIVNDHENGTLVIKLASRYSGILKVEIDAVQNSPRYDYDASLEVYDMYETRSTNGAYTANESADFKLNNNDAYYLKFTNNDLSLNERIAIDKTNTWTFAHGLQASSNWSNLSICNLREGDRVLIYYTGDAPIFSSNGNNGDYTGNAAYKDTWNDGMLDTDEGDHIISKGDPVEYTYCRKEGAFGNEEDYPHIWLYTSYPYVMMENGHLDLALSNGNHTRIVKVKIYSDHQAMMVDDYDNQTYTYTAYYNITGELQSKEHIVPGGLEVHVGNDDAADQHANVVFSKEGPVSYVKAVDGYKIPGISRDTNGQIQNNFNLANEAPQTGTYYRFIPESSGQMTIRFKAVSLNYYRWDLKADDIYFADGWSTEFDRSNEWPMDRACPYYLMVQDGDSYSSASFKIDNDNSLSSGAFYKNNEYVTLTLDVEAGKTYYLYGTWDQKKDGDDDNSIGSTSADLTERPACGIAELLWVKFNPENKIYPLAKWVPNDTKAVNEANKVPNPDDPSVLEGELADVVGYVGATITVKKMSGNIIACRPYIQRANPEDREGKLMIDGIEFATNKNPGGTILIKIGDPESKTAPLYALTIAYSTNYDGENGLTGDDGRGHTWDLTTNSLNGIKWDLAPNAYVKSVAPDYNTTFTTSTGGYATPAPYGTYFKDYYANEASIANFSNSDDVLKWFKDNNKINIGSLLEEEIDYPDHHGNIRSDWLFGYNLVYGDKLYDPVFKNKYDMEGDNADMIWDTEGTVIRTSANQSVIFNEFTGTNIHSSDKDPNRYVGILEGGEFRIPWLMKDDRVIIYMGTGTGRYADEVKFNIRGAYDAVHNEISESDDYIVGGSQWNSANSDNYYRGCYHFFAQGNPNDATKPADMVFKMKEGSLCKIYKIQIYRGDRIITNEIVDNAAAENQFLLYSMKADPNEASSTDYTDNTAHEWTLKYLGKEQQLANGTGKNSQENEIIAQTGKYNSTPALTVNYKVVEDEATSQVESFTYKHSLGEIGTFRMRGKDMEKNMNYVADYADHNVTIAYQETQKYPYTWDFTDVTGIAANVTNLFDPEEKLGETIESTTKPDGLTDEEWAAIWNSLDGTSYQKTSRDLSLWEVSGSSGNYFLRLNSQTSQTLNNPMEKDNIFETAKEIGGNQVWANGTIVPEMQGLWFYTEYTDETNQPNQPNLDNYQENGEWTIKQGDANNVGGLEFDGSGDFLKVVVPNVPKDAAVYFRMTKTLPNGAVVKFKFGEDDLATINNADTRRFYQVPGTNYDYVVALLNTNSSKSDLTLSLNGYRIHKMAVSTDPKKVNKLGWATESRDHVIDPELTSYLTGREFKTYIVTGADHASKTVTLAEVEVNKNVMPISENGDANAYIIRNMNLDTNPSNKEPGRVKILNDGFHLFVPDMHDYIADREDGLTNLKSLQDMTSSLMKSQLTEGTVPQKGGENVYNYVLTTETAIAGANGENLSGSEQSLNYVGFFRAQKSGVSSSGNQGYLPLSVSTNAKYSFVFVKDWEVSTAIEVASGIESVEGNASYYNMNGQRLNGRPSKSGIYIVNGKKVVLK